MIWQPPAVFNYQNEEKYLEKLASSVVIFDTFYCLKRIMPKLLFFGSLCSACKILKTSENFKNTDLLNELQGVSH